jgi:hypothetical protein
MHRRKGAWAACAALAWPLNGSINRVADASRRGASAMLHQLTDRLRIRDRESRLNDLCALHGRGRRHRKPRRKTRVAARKPCNLRLHNQLKWLLNPFPNGKVGLRSAHVGTNPTGRDQRRGLRIAGMTGGQTAHEDVQRGLAGPTDREATLSVVGHTAETG